MTLPDGAFTPKTRMQHRNSQRRRFYKHLTRARILNRATPERVRPVVVGAVSFPPGRDHCQIRPPVRARLRVGWGTLQATFIRTDPSAFRRTTLQFVKSL